MTKWVMPHDEMPEELVTPTTAAPRFVLPHVAEEDAAARKSPAQETLESESPGARVLIGAGSLLNRARLGAKQRAGQLGSLLGMKNRLSQEVIDELAANREAETAISGDPYATAGKVGAGAAIGLATPVARVLPAAATGAAVEGILAPMEDPTLGNILTEAGKGAIQYGAGQLAGNALVGSAARAKNTLQGKFADPEVQNRYRIFREYGVPFSRGDLSQDLSTLRFENAARRIPLSGRAEFMEEQARKLGEVMESAPEQIAGGVAQRTKEDVGSAIVKSVKDKYLQNKQVARDMYNAVSARVQAVGAPPVPTTELADAANKLLQKYPTAFAKLTDDPSTVRALQEIAAGTGPQASVILNQSGKPIMKAPQLTFDELRALDSDLGALIRQGRTLSARGEYNSKTFEQLAEVQKALRRDIDNWATAVGDPEITTGVKTANKFFRENVMPFRKSSLTRDVIQDGNVDADTVVNRFFRADAPWRSEQALQFLTDDGLQAGRYHLVKEAEKRAMNEALESGYSPSQFLRGTKLGETGPKLFSADQLRQLEDLKELVRSSRRAAGYSADPETGAALSSLAPLLSMKVPAAAKMYSSISQSEPWSKFLLSTPRLYTGGGALGKASESILRKLGTGAVGAAVE